MSCVRIHVLVVTVLICATCVDATAEEFKILTHPDDIVADEGELVHLQCQHNETGFNDFPRWIINDTLHTVTNLPDGFYANESGLVFPAYSSVNNTRFQCYFILHSTTGTTERHFSRVGVVTVRQQGGMSQRSSPSCKPRNMIITVSGTGTVDFKFNLTWMENEVNGCRSGVNAFLVQVAVCADRVAVCANSSLTMPPTDVCNISTNTTYIGIDSSTCPALRMNQPLVFRVKNVNCNGTDGFCYTNYLYLASLEDTGQLSAVTGAPWNCSISGKCNSPNICISNPPKITVCGSVLDDILPGSHTFVATTMDDITLIIEVVSEDLDNAVYTLKCDSCLSCSKYAVEVVVKNFQLSVAHTAIPESSTTVSWSSTVIPEPSSCSVSQLQNSSTLCEGADITKPTDHGSDNSGLIIGTVIGSIVLVSVIIACIVVLCVCWWWYKLRREYNVERHEARGTRRTEGSTTGRTVGSTTGRMAGSTTGRTAGSTTGGTELGNVPSFSPGDDNDSGD